MPRLGPHGDGRVVLLLHDLCRCRQHMVQVAFPSRRVQAISVSASRGPIQHRLDPAAQPVRPSRSWSSRLAPAPQDLRQADVAHLRRADALGKCLPGVLRHCSACLALRHLDSWASMYARADASNVNAMRTLLHEAGCRLFCAQQWDRCPCLTFSRSRGLDGGRLPESHQGNRPGPCSRRLPATINRSTQLRGPLGWTWTRKPRNAADGMRSWHRQPANFHVLKVPSICFGILNPAGQPTNVRRLDDVPETQ